MATTQNERLVTIETPLGTDALLVESFTATEKISGLFQCHLELFSERPSVPLDAIIGKPVTIAIELADGSSRFFHGIVSRFGQSGRGQTGRDPRFTSYYAEVVPWLWFLTRTSDCRIFQNLTVPEIVKKVFQDQGFRDFREVLTKTYTKWDYCVQYRETDFNFVSRLFEHEGIVYFFEHERGKHTLVFADSADAHKSCPGQATARFSPEGGIGEREDTIVSWQMEQELRPGKYTLRDYHFEMPSKSLEMNSVTTVEGGGKSQFEVYEYQGEYTQQFNKPGERLGEVEKEGEKLVKLRMQQEESPHLTIHGASSCRAFISGFRFDLASPPTGVAAGAYLLTSVQHSAMQGGDFVSGADLAVGYSNSFTSIPFKLPFKPERLTPKPVMQGTQTAVVVGPAGEEIYTDKYGRIKVQFHWDREGKKDENSSCWIRVAQAWAGKQWGGIYIPRIGQEVVIAFQEGDPDQPLVIGGVYNAEQMPPYELPAQQVISGFKSNSTKGGGGYNEFVMDDTKKKELIRTHAQFDMDTTVENDDRQTIHRNRKIKVDGTHSETIDGATDITITGGTFSHDVAKNTAKYHVKGALTENYDNTQTTTIIQNLTINCGAKISVTAKDEIKLVTGASMILMQSDGTIQIHGKNIEVIGTNEVKNGVGNQNTVFNTQLVKTSGAAINSEAKGTHEIIGMPVKIN